MTAADLVRLDVAVRRPASLGPFPSARDGAKFLAYAAVGALVAGVASPWMFVPFAAFGFVSSVHRADEKAPDRRLAEAVAYGLRRRTHRGRRSFRPRIVRGGAIVELAPGHLAAVVSAGGVPVAFLPPAAARGLFHSYRTLLQSLGTNVGMVVGGRPLADRQFRPRLVPSTAPERAARDGYDLLLQLLTHHRRSRRVLVVVSGPDGGGAGHEQLRRSAGAIESSLRAIGVPAARLVGRDLLRAGLELHGRGGGLP